MLDVRGRVRSLLNKSGYTLHRHAPEDGYARFFELMRPVRTEHPLIRLGGDGDGGYLVPDDLDGIEACFSPGVDRVATFEKDVIDRGIRTFQIDASVETSPLVHPANVFERKFLGIETRDHFITLDDWVGEKVGPTSGDLLLQMDIEGAEWVTLAAVSDATLQRFRIIVMELHYLHYVFEPFGPPVILPVLERLARLFDVVHLHANNYGIMGGAGDHSVPEVLEVTLLRKDRSVQRTPVTELPHPLDQDNSNARPPVHIPRSMYG